MTTSTTGALVALSAELAAAVARAGASVVFVDSGSRHSATGTAWTEHTIVTADHAVEEDDVTLALHDGTSARATIVGRDPSTDLALLRTSATLQPAFRGNVAALRVGHLVLAIGCTDEGGASASLGVISALEGRWRTWRGGDVERFIRPDVSLYPGFSGGPLVDAEGAVLGVNTWGLSRRTALTVPLETIERVAAQLESAGRIARGYLGVAMQTVRLPEGLGAAHGIDGRGAVIVVDVAPHGPAAEGGILMGDVILSIAGQRVEDSDDVQHALRGDLVGSRETIRLVRGGALLDVTIAIGERPHDG